MIWMIIFGFLLFWLKWWESELFCDWWNCLGVKFWLFWVWLMGEVDVFVVVWCKEISCELFFGCNVEFVVVFVFVWFLVFLFLFVFFVGVFFVGFWIVFLLLVVLFVFDCFLRGIICCFFKSFLWFFGRNICNWLFVFWVF